MEPFEIPSLPMASRDGIDRFQRLFENLRDSKMSLLQKDIARTINSCTDMLDCFSRCKDWSNTSYEQKRVLVRALDGTISHLEDSLAKVELQIRNAANRGDARAVQDWDLWRAQIRQKRNALRDISTRLV